MRETASDREILEVLGQRLQRERLNRNMTQEAVAERAGLTRETLAKIEGGTNFSMESLLRIFRTLGLLSRLDALLPEPGVSPIQLAELRGKQRERATGRRGRAEEPRAQPHSDQEQQGGD